MAMGLIAMAIALAIYVNRDVMHMRDTQIIMGFEGNMYNLTSYDVKPSGEYHLVRVNHWVPHDPSGRLLQATNPAQ